MGPSGLRKLTSVVIHSDSSGGPPKTAQACAPLERRTLRRPAPSLKQVVSRSGYSSSYISVSFPIQREAIKGRYRNFKKRLAAQQKAAAKARIRQIASDLH